MSTEHQQYSTENQGDKILEYAARRNIEIVRTYADEGKSGLRIDGRQALQQLIKDVETGNADFQIILVYDVSRWGRFQDADESAYYEYICRRAGIQVAYCAEQFENWLVTGAHINLYYPPEPGKTRPKVVTIEVTRKGRLNLHKFDAALQAQLEGYLVSLGILQKGQTLNPQETPPSEDVHDLQPAFEH